MTKNVLKNILMTVIPVVLCCCSEEKKSEQVNAVTDYETSVLSFDTVGHFYADTLNPQFKYAYNLTLPKEGISSCADSIRLAMIAEATGVRSNDIEVAKRAKLSSIVVISEEEVAAYREYFSSNEIPFDFEYEAGKVYEDGDVYNSVIKSYSYTGGAHPNSYANFQIWDKLTAKKLMLDDIFVDGYETKLTDMILDSLCKIMKVNERALLADAGILDVKDVTPNNSMRIYPDSLSFNYKPYEIAAYAVGPIEVKFAFEDLKSLMRQESPLYKFVE